MVFLHRCTKGAISVIIILLIFHTPAGAKPATESWKEKFLQMDLVGVALMMGALLAYGPALQYGGQIKPWNSSDVVSPLVRCIAILIMFDFWGVSSANEQSPICAYLRSEH